jgi:hypothetical protein
LPVTASAFGLIAETFISAKYLTHRGKSAWFPVSGTDFLDISVGFGNSALYIAFLKANNSHVSISHLLALSAAGLLKIPDMCTHDSAVEEFYEIKPNSYSGRFAGRVKVAAIQALNSRLSLPYTQGVRWGPDDHFVIFDGMFMGAKVKVTFHFFKIHAGLIVYELCIEGELAKLALHLLVALLIAIILILLGRGGIVPIPAPPPIPA